MIKLQELADMAKEISSKKWFLNADEEVTAIDNDAGPDETEAAFIGCAANIQLAKYMAAANPDTILAIAEAYSALEQRLKAAETEVQHLNATAQPVSDGWVTVPRSLTAENGAKAALLGEFSVQQNITCHECFGEGCDDCNGQGNWTNSVPVDWTTIKEIWAKGVEHFLAAAPGGQDD